jgi:hypothetical protein
VVSAVVEATSATFVTLVVPLAADDPLPRLNVRRQGERTAVEVDGRHAVAWWVEAGALTLDAGAGS